MIAAPVASADPLIAPGTPVVGTPQAGGTSIAFAEGGGIGVQSIITTATGANPISVIPGDVVFLNDPSGGDTASNFAAVLDFFNPADPTGTMGLAATEYQTFYGGNVGADTLAGLNLSANTVYLVQDPGAATGVFTGDLAALNIVFGPSADIFSGQEAFFFYYAAFQPAVATVPSSTVPEPLTLSLFGTGLVGLVLMRRRGARDTISRERNMRNRFDRILLQNARPAGFAALLLFGVLSPAWADPIVDPNPGGMYIDADLISAVATYTQTPVVQDVNDYTTTLLAYLNGVEVFQTTYQFAYGSPMVQNGVAQVDALLTGDNASFGAPALDLSNTNLQSSMTLPYTTYSCEQLTGYVHNNDLPANITWTGANVTGSTSVGPETLNVDYCGDNELIVNPGQTAILENTEEDFSIAVDVPTIDTYLTSTTYEIDGVSAAAAPPPGPTQVPESGTGALLAAGLSSLVMLRHRRAKTR